VYCSAVLMCFKALKHMNWNSSKTLLLSSQF